MSRKVIGLYILFLSFKSFGMQKTASPSNDLAILTILYEHFDPQKVDETLRIFRIYKETSITLESNIFFNRVLLTELCYDLALSESIFSANILTDTLEEEGASPITMQTMAEFDSKVHDNLPHLLIALDDIKKIGKQLITDYKKILQLSHVLAIDCALVHEKLSSTVSCCGTAIEIFIRQHFNTPARQFFLKEHYNGCLDPWMSLYEDLSARATPD